MIHSGTNGDECIPVFFQMCTCLPICRFGLCAVVTVRLRCNLLLRVFDSLVYKQ